MDDDANAEYSAPLGESPAVPAGPVDGTPAPDADSEFIMSTLFGQDKPPEAAKPVEAKPAGDQVPGAKPAGGEEPGSAPPSPSPAAKEPAAAPPVEQPPVPGAVSPQQGKEQKPAETPPITPAPGTPPAAVEPAPAETRLTPEERLQLASLEGLRQQNQQLLDALRQTQAPQPAQPAGTGTQPPATPPSGVPIEQVHLTVPDALYGAVFAEDEQTSRHGINVLVSSIATAAVNHVLQKVGPMIDQRVAGYDQVSQQRTTAAAQEQDYYANFQGHANPLFRPVIESEMQKMAQEMPNAPWNDDFRNALGTRVNRTLQLLGFDVGMVPGAKPNGGGPPAPPIAGFSPPATPQAEQPAPMLEPGSRPAAPSNPEDFIAATFA